MKIVKRIIDRKPAIIDGIKILRGITPIDVKKRRSDYKDWNAILSAMRKGDLAILPRRGYWMSAKYRADKLGIKLELVRHNGAFALWRKN